MSAKTFREFVQQDPTMMMRLMQQMQQNRQFMQQDNMEEEKGDIQKTLSKLPPSHAALVKDYQWKFHTGNTLNGDSRHVGYVDDAAKEIAVAGPWNYGREFTILHEVAHKVWEHFVTPEMKQEWHHIVARTKNRQKQEPEELFCMAYANHYAKNKIVIHTHKEWDDFIKRIPQ